MPFEPGFRRLALILARLGNQPRGSSADLLVPLIGLTLISGPPRPFIDEGFLLFQADDESRHRLKSLSSDEMRMIADECCQATELIAPSVIPDLIIDHLNDLKSFLARRLTPQQKMYVEVLCR